MFARFAKQCCSVALFGALLSWAQATEKQDTRATASTNAKEQLHKLKLVEADVTSLSPLVRAHAYCRLAQAYAAISEQWLRKSLQDCFLSTVGVGDDEVTQQAAERYQLESLAWLTNLDPRQASSLLPIAAPHVKQILAGRSAEKSAAGKDYEAAMEQLYAASNQEGDFPYGPALRVMESLPPERFADRSLLFSQALANYRLKDDHFFDIDANGLVTMIVRFWKNLPSALTLEAIQEVLERSKPKEAASNHLEITVSTTAGSESFRSMYEFRVYQLLPILAELEPGTANKLKEENRRLAIMPKGFEDAFRESSQSGPSDAGAASMSFRIAKNGPASDVTELDLLRRKLENEANLIINEGQRESEKALKDAALMMDIHDSADWRSVKGDTLLGIARIAVKSSKLSIAQQALDQLIALMNGHSPMLAARYLAGSASLYLDMGDTENAWKAIKLGQIAAIKLYEKDTDAHDPNRALKIYWPSTVTTNILAAMASRISTNTADTFADDIADTEIRTLVRIELLNSSMRHLPPPALMMYQRKDGAAVTRTFELP